MIDCEVIVVGGGPGGAAAAWELTRLGRSVLVLDREPFPREKLCAGWVTPEVFADLECRPEDYPHGLVRLDSLKTHIYGLNFEIHSPQYSVRRVEFDHWLLQRSGAESRVHAVRSVEETPGGYDIDGAFRCEHLIGAGGTRCPVYRALFRDGSSRRKETQAVALEREFAYDWHDADCHLWFLTDGLAGYSWYVPKANGVLNVGVGGMSDRLRHRDDDIKRHWSALVQRLRYTGLVTEAPPAPQGYSYYLNDNPTLRRGSARLVGDAAGLATRDMCEGIGPAVRSGINAARSVAEAGPQLPLAPFTLQQPMLRRALENRVAGRWLKTNAHTRSDQVGRGERNGRLSV